MLRLKKMSVGKALTAAAAVALVSVIFVLTLGCWTVMTARLPRFEAVRARHVSSDAWLLDRHGEPLQSLRIDHRRRCLEWVPLDAVSPAVWRSIVAAEDRRFFAHAGIDWRGVLGGLRDTALGNVRGASTLSMQTVSLLDPQLRAQRGTRRGLQQKWRQAMLAVVLERQWDKRQIAEAYLNSVDFRGELSGIAAASQGIFGKDPAGLTQAESWLLAALLPAPNATAEQVRRRACRIARADASVCRVIQTADRGGLDRSRPIAASVSLAPQLARQLLRTPGARVRSTLDKRIQLAAMEVMSEQLRELTEHNARDGAALVVDNASGAVLAYVASAGPWSQAAAVDGIRAPRQAGSTLKPFLYALAIERRLLTAASILDDTPVALRTGAGLYVPQNYDRDFKGPVSARNALASSLNVPAVRTLELTGIGAFHARLKALGFSTLEDDPEFYGFSLALGSADVSLWDEVQAYRALANGGILAPLYVHAGAAGKQTSNAAVRVMNADAVFIVADILADRASRGLSFGLENPLTTRFWTAVKTGTSKDMRDNWCIGFSQRYTVGVWIGNFEGESMRAVSGISGAAPAWLGIMNVLHAAEISAVPLPPETAIAREVNFASRLEPARREWFIAGTEPERNIQRPSPIALARILEPADGALIVIDPDIPQQRQRVLFVSENGQSIRWRLNGTDLGSAKHPLAWQPHAGTYELALIADSGTVQDKVSFTVRGRP